MNIIPIWVELSVLAGLILVSAFFSMTETALMAINRHRLKHLAKRGNKLAITTTWLLERTNKLLSLILIANTVINALVTALLTSLAIETFGNDDKVITIATATIAFFIIVFAEITPKIIGATYPERIALPASIILRPLLAFTQPLIWFVNLFVNALLQLLRIDVSKKSHEQRLSQEELRSIVLEGGSFIPQKHKSILLNLFDLENISVNDVMTPRSQMEALNIYMPIADIKQQLVTCEHNKLPVYEGEINQIIGILHVRKAIVLLNQSEVKIERLRQLLSTPYFIPEETDVFAQLQYFQENREKLGIIIDEYGEVQGLVTLEDILEEMIGEFTTSVSGDARTASLTWNAKQECQLEASSTLRDINKRLKLHFPLDGPKTLNGLLLEYLQDIPEANISLKLSGCIIEVLEVRNQTIKVVKLIRNPDMPLVK
ncbi:HlyC/CorC family transporter [Undibacterium sp. Ren11W]|uniref:HlyC/CorC family transporter n=1 Tax=Undibacterium sp. Ren11W TaxID=3413045 RepID=UPI003BEFC665